LLTEFYNRLSEFDFLGVALPSGDTGEGTAGIGSAEVRAEDL